eukprot:TRINITY_DN67776_c6_g1_i1.p1 TRINITY_DN67776_c6_g1~~TRINITY_DN67776_c6_g1_i1.p1  ORF type:complete len:1158 (+),score=208.08 TRINITY_DN67776_c6_g1_i1:75-3548(+)
MTQMNLLVLVQFLSLFFLVATQNDLPTCFPSQPWQLCQAVLTYPAAPYLPPSVIPTEGQATAIFQNTVTNNPFASPTCRERALVALCMTLFAKCDEGADNVRRLVPPCEEVCSAQDEFNCRGLIEDMFKAIVPTLNAQALTNPCETLFSDDADGRCILTTNGQLKCRGTTTATLAQCEAPRQFQCPAADACPFNVGVVNCLISPCAFATCAKYPTATCCDNYCGGCNRHWYIGSTRVNCEGGAYDGVNLDDIDLPTVSEGISDLSDLPLGGYQDATDYFFVETDRTLKEGFGTDNDFDDVKLTDYYYTDLTDFYYTDDVTDYFFRGDQTDFFGTDFFTDFTDGVADGPLLDTGVALDTGVSAIDAVQDPTDYLDYWPGPHDGVDAPYDGAYGFGNVNIDAILPDLPEDPIEQPDLNEEDAAWRDWLYHFYGSQLRDGEFGYYDALEWEEKIHYDRTKDMIMTIGLDIPNTRTIFGELIAYAVNDRNTALRFQPEQLHITGIRPVADLGIGSNLDQLERINLDMIRGYNIAEMNDFLPGPKSKAETQEAANGTSKWVKSEESLCDQFRFQTIPQIAVLFHITLVPKGNIVQTEELIRDIYTETTKLCDHADIPRESRFFIRRPSAGQCPCDRNALCLAPNVCECTFGYVGDGRNCFVDQCLTDPEDPTYGHYVDCRKLPSGVTQCPLRCEPGKYKTNDAFCLEGRWMRPLPTCTAPRCGDGRKNRDEEECDGDDIPVSTCSAYSSKFTSGVVLCTPGCKLDLLDCRGCGDGIVNQPTEECDLRDVPLRLCHLYDSRYWGGIMTCNADCTYNHNFCWTKYCGDGRINQDSEECDGSHRPAELCAVYNPVEYTAGSLRCNADCTLNYESCTRKFCGDGRKNRPEEQCDRFDLVTTDCRDISDSFIDGVVTCDQNCKIDISQCRADPKCGNNAIDQREEECDGIAFPGGAMTCAQFDSKYWSGNLRCRDDCTMNLNDCREPVCGDDAVNLFAEECDGTDSFTECSQLDPKWIWGKLTCTDGCTYDTSACIQRPNTTNQCRRAFEKRLDNHWLADCRARDRCNCINDALLEMIDYDCCNEDVIAVCKEFAAVRDRCDPQQCHCHRAMYGVCPTLMTCPETFVNENCESRSPDDDCTVPNCPNHSELDMLLHGCFFIHRSDAV